MFMVEADQNHIKMNKNITPNDTRLWPFRNSISMVEANQNHTNMTKHTTPSDARLWAFRNKISIVEANQNHFKNYKQTIHQVMPYYEHSETRSRWWRLIKTT